MNSEQALVRNMRTCRPDDKGEAVVVEPHRESTDAGHRGGLSRSSDEASVSWRCQFFRGRFITHGAQCVVSWVFTITRTPRRSRSPEYALSRYLMRDQSIGTILNILRARSIKWNATDFFAPKI